VVLMLVQGYVDGGLENDQHQEEAYRGACDHGYETANNDCDVHDDDSAIGLGH